jgi:cation diffusion facilitator CzcD-associated flavoprotein CzcO
VVVASSHYQHPHYPVIPGLAQLQHRYPDSVIHSAQYRQPERFAGQNVIVVGDSVSRTLPEVCTT